MNISESATADIINDLQQKYPDKVLDVKDHDGATVIVRVNREVIHDVLKTLYEDHRFIYLLQVFGTDRFTSENRFEVVYHIFSLRDQVRIFIKTWLDEGNTVLPTSTDIWKAANWQEREVYDMFGITFTGHPDLRRMFMPEDFEYYPLRKEFPPLGIPGSIQLPSTTPDSEED
jgi:NADH-quinone oxidoreductase subunit C